MLSLMSQNNLEFITDAFLPTVNILHEMELRKTVEHVNINVFEDDDIRDIRDIRGRGRWHHHLTV